MIIYFPLFSQIYSKNYFQKLKGWFSATEYIFLKSLNYKHEKQVFIDLDKFNDQLFIFYKYT